MPRGDDGTGRSADREDHAARANDREALETATISEAAQGRSTPPLGMLLAAPLVAALGALAGMRMRRPDKPPRMPRTPKTAAKGVQAGLGHSPPAAAPSSGEVLPDKARSSPIDGAGSSAESGDVNNGDAVESVDPMGPLLHASPKPSSPALPGSRPAGGSRSTGGVPAGSRSRTTRSVDRVDRRLDFSSSEGETGTSRLFAHVSPVLPATSAALGRGQSPAGPAEEGPRVGVGTGGRMPAVETVRVRLAALSALVAGLAGQGGADGRGGEGLTGPQVAELHGALLRHATVLLDLEAEVQAAAVQARVVTDLEGREEAVREREGRVGMAEEELRERKRATEALRLSLEVRAAAIEAEAGMLERREVAASAAQSRMRALEESMGSVGRGGAGDEGGEERVREMEREVERKDRELRMRAHEAVVLKGALRAMEAEVEQRERRARAAEEAAGAAAAGAARREREVEGLMRDAERAMRVAEARSREAEGLMREAEGRAGELRTREEQVERREGEVAARAEAVEGLSTEVGRREAGVAERERELAEKEREMADRNTALSDRVGALVGKEREWAERDAALTEREGKLADKEREWADREVAVVGKESAVAEKEGALSAREAALTDREQAVVSKESALGDKERELADKGRELAGTESALADRESALRDSERALTEREGELTERETAVADRDRVLVGSESALAERESILSERDSALADRERALVGKEQVLIERETALSEREQVLVGRESALADKDATVTHREQVLSERGSALAEREQVLSQRDHALTDREQAVVGKEIALSERDGALADRERELAGKESSLAEREQTVVGKETSPTDRESALSDRERSLADREGVLADKEQALSDRELALSEKERALTDRETALTEKEREVEFREAEVAAVEAVGALAREGAETGEHAVTEGVRGAVSLEDRKREDLVRTRGADGDEGERGGEGLREGGGEGMAPGMDGADDALAASAEDSAMHPSVGEAPAAVPVPASGVGEQALADRERAVVEREQSVIEREHALVEREQAVAEREQGVAEAEGRVAEERQAVAEGQQALAERERRVAEQAQAVGEREVRVAEGERELTQREQGVVERVAEGERALAGKEQALADRERAVVDRESRVASAEERVQAQAWDLERRADAWLREARERAEPAGVSVSASPDLHDTAAAEEGAGHHDGGAEAGPGSPSLARALEAFAVDVSMASERDTPFSMGASSAASHRPFAFNGPPPAASQSPTLSTLAPPMVHRVPFHALPAPTPDSLRTHALHAIMRGSAVEDRTPLKDHADVAAHGEANCEDAHQDEAPSVVGPRVQRAPVAVAVDHDAPGTPGLSVRTEEVLGRATATVARAKTQARVVAVHAAAGDVRGLEQRLREAAGDGDARRAAGSGGEKEEGLRAWELALRGRQARVEEAERSLAQREERLAAEARRVRLTHVAVQRAEAAVGPGHADTTGAAMARQEALDTREEELLRRDLALDAREERLRARERVTADAEAAAKRDVARAVEALGGAQARVAEAEGRLRDVARREAACAAAETRARAEGERARGLLREAAQKRDEAVSLAQSLEREARAVAEQQAALKRAAGELGERESALQRRLQSLEAARARADDAAREAGRRAAEARDAEAAARGRVEEATRAEAAARAAAEAAAAREVGVERREVGVAAREARVVAREGRCEEAERGVARREQACAALAAELADREGRVQERERACDALAAELAARERAVARGGGAEGAAALAGAVGEEQAAWLRSVLSAAGMSAVEVLGEIQSRTEAAKAAEARATALLGRARAAERAAEERLRAAGEAAEAARVKAAVAAEREAALASRASDLSARETRLSQALSASSIESGAALRDAVALAALATAAGGLVGRGAGVEARRSHRAEAGDAGSGTRGVRRSGPGRAAGAVPRGLRMGVETGEGSEGVCLDSGVGMDGDGGEGAAAKTGVLADAVKDRDASAKAGVDGAGTQRDGIGSAVRDRYARTPYSAGPVSAPPISPDPHPSTAPSPLSLATTPDATLAPLVSPSPTSLAPASAHPATLASPGPPASQSQSDHRPSAAWHDAATPSPRLFAMSSPGSSRNASLQSSPHKAAEHGDADGSAESGATKGVVGRTGPASGPRGRGRRRRAGREHDSGGVHVQEEGRGSQRGRARGAGHSHRAHLGSRALDIAHLMHRASADGHAVVSASRVVTTQSASVSSPALPRDSVSLLAVRRGLPAVGEPLPPGAGADATASQARSVSNTVTVPALRLGNSDGPCKSPRSSSASAPLAGSPEGEGVGEWGGRAWRRGGVGASDGAAGDGSGAECGSPSPRTPLRENGECAASPMTMGPPWRLVEGGDRGTRD